jgi:hypothetical protein
VPIGQRTGIGWLSGTVAPPPTQGAPTSSPRHPPDASRVRPGSASLRDHRCGARAIDRPAGPLPTPMPRVAATTPQIAVGRMPDRSGPVEGGSAMDKAKIAAYSRGRRRTITGCARRMNNRKSRRRRIRSEVRSAASAVDHRLRQIRHADEFQRLGRVQLGGAGHHGLFGDGPPARPATLSSYKAIEKQVTQSFRPRSVAVPPSPGRPVGEWARNPSAGKNDLKAGRGHTP